MLNRFVGFVILGTGILLLPASLSNAGNDTPLENVCRQNLTRLYQAIELYRAAHDGAYPPANAAGVLWPELIKKYIEGEPETGLNPDGPFYCPSVPKERRDPKGRSAYVSYGYNAFALGCGTGEFTADPPD